MRTPELIATHTNTDFDAFAAMLAAHKLYPEARMCLGGTVNRNVREFQRLYADLIPVVDPTDVERDSVRRLIMVDTVHANRLGELADLCGRSGVQVVAFDHHAREQAAPEYIGAGDLVTSDDGSLVTLLVHIIAERGIRVTPFEATVFALGIHEDTGSLTFSTTTPRDAQALAFCMEQGADTALLERWLANTLSPPQRRTLAAALESAEELPVADATVLLAALREELYVEGVSVVAHRVMDLTGCDAFFLLVAMENRVFVTARSRGGRLDVARALAAVGGGGHAAAASAVVKDRSLEEVAAAVRTAAPAALVPVATARDALAPGLHAVPEGSPVDEAAILCRRERVGGVAVLSRGRLAGSCRAHRPRPRRGPRTRPRAGEVGGHVGRGRRWRPTRRWSAWRRSSRRTRSAGCPWSSTSRTARCASRTCSGVVTRGAVIGEVGQKPAEPRPAANLAGSLAELGLDDLLRHVQAVAPDYRGVFLVGGAVRDILLGVPGFDVDLAVEGDGIAFGTELARRLRGHVRPHDKFGTAVVVAGGADARLRVDVASTRSESYAVPGGAAQGAARRHRQRPGPPRFFRQRDGRVAQARDLRESARPARRARRPRGAPHRRAP